MKGMTGRLSLLPASSAGLILFLLRFGSVLSFSAFPLFLRLSEEICMSGVIVRAFLFFFGMPRRTCQFDRKTVGSSPFDLRYGYGFLWEIRVTVAQTEDSSGARKRQLI